MFFTGRGGSDAGIVTDEFWKNAPKTTKEPLVRKSLNTLNNFFKSFNNYGE